LRRADGAGVVEPLAEQPEVAALDLVDLQALPEPLIEVAQLVDPLGPQADGAADGLGGADDALAGSTVQRGQLDAGEALGLGLLDRVVDDGTALDAALALAERLAAFPRAPLRMAKRAIAALVQASGAATALDVDQFVAAASSDAFAASLRAFRKP
jgi:hypothetical protein